MKISRRPEQPATDAGGSVYFALAGWRAKKYSWFCAERFFVNEVQKCMENVRAEIGELFRQVNREIHERFRHAFKEKEMPPFGTMIMLRVIDHHPGVTVSELARRSGMVKSHISKTLEQLESQGQVEKRPDPEDQRLLRIFLTRAAREDIKQKEALATALWSEVLEQLPDAELEAAVRGLRVLRDAFGKANARPDEPNKE